MKRLAMLALVGLSAAALCACDHQSTASVYDPQLDGVLPHPTAAPDQSILENQKKLYDTMIAATGGMRTPAPAPAASAPASAPAAAPAATPAPEGEGARAAPAPATTPAAAPAGEGNPPGPPPQ